MKLKKFSIKWKSNLKSNITLEILFKASLGRSNAIKTVNTDRICFRQCGNHIMGTGEYELVVVVGNIIVLYMSDTVIIMSKIIS